MPQLKGLERWNYIIEHKQAGMGQKAIAKKLGLTHSNLRNWLSNNREKYASNTNNITLPTSVLDPITNNSTAYIAEESDEYFDWLDESLHNYWEKIPPKWKHHILYLLTPIQEQPDKSTYAFTEDCVLMQYSILNEDSPYGIDMTIIDEEDDY